MRVSSLASLLPVTAREKRDRMTEIASIIASSADGAPRRKEEPREASAQFSYALAAASLETRAAKSLEAHGAAPDRSGVKAGDASNAPAEETVKPTSSQPQATTPDDKPAQSRIADRPAQPANASTTGAAVAPALPAQPLLQAGVTIQLINVASAKAADASVAARDIASAKSKFAAAKAEKPQPAPAALKAEFAAILAKRLEKTSVFDLRLDPPELGRVEGKLVVNDDGKSVLSLTFDNQNAFDLYARDEQALRLALQNAGLSFGAGDFNLSYRDPVEAAGDAFAGLATAPAEAVSHETAFHAAWSAGALDIRI